MYAPKKETGAVRKTLRRAFTVRIETEPRSYGCRMGGFCDVEYIF